jgi:hypothetical protein
MAPGPAGLAGGWASLQRRPALRTRKAWILGAPGHGSAGGTALRWMPSAAAVQTLILGYWPGLGVEDSGVAGSSKGQLVRSGLGCQGNHPPPRT